MGDFLSIDPTFTNPIIGFLMHSAWYLSSTHPFLFRGKKQTKGMLTYMFIAIGSFPLLFVNNAIFLSYSTLIAAQILLNTSRNGTQKLAERKRNKDLSVSIKRIEKLYKFDNSD